MKLFLDTSSLFKLYHQEADSANVESLFTDYTISAVFLSEVAKIEFSSTVWKKVRTQEINVSQAHAIIEAFEKDFDKYLFIQIDAIIIEQARIMLTKYGMQGLRTLDSIQLSTAVLVNNQADLFVSIDSLLDSFFQQENLPTQRPAI